MKKTCIIRVRVDKRQKAFWKRALAELGVDSFSLYARNAIDRSIALDFRSQDRKWQEFIAEVQPTALRILGHYLTDNAADRNKDLKDIDDALRANEAYRRRKTK